MIINDKKYVAKYAIFYSLVIFAILIVPLYVYYTFLNSINEASTQLKMVQELNRVLIRVENHDSKTAFIYPRSKVYKSGLYTQKFEEIFSLIDSKSDIEKLRIGYNQIANSRYYVKFLNHNRYFNARYIIVKVDYDNSNLIKKTLIILLSILFIIFGLSILILKNFSKPFQEINSSLDRFIKNSIHEINTPVTIINMSSDFLKIKYGENKYIDRIKGASRTLSTIYDDMNYLMKKDRIEYVRKLYNLSEFVDDRVKYFEPIATIKNISLVSEVESDIFYEFNSTEFKRLVDNNISNAIKYSYEKGLVTIGLKKDNNTILLTITDCGVGIEDVNRVLDRYYSENSIKGGFGIGLNIVKSIANKYKIKLKIESKLNKGSQFKYKINITKKYI